MHELITTKNLYYCPKCCTEVHAIIIRRGLFIAALLCEKCNTPLQSKRGSPPCGACVNCGKPKKKRVLNRWLSRVGFKVCSYKCYQEMRQKNLEKETRRCECCGVTKPMKEFNLIRKTLTFEHLCKKCSKMRYQHPKIVLSEELKNRLK